MSRRFLMRCIGVFAALILVAAAAVLLLVADSRSYVPGAFETGRSHPKYGPIYVTRAVEPGLLNPSRRPVRMQLWMLRKSLRAKLGLPAPPAPPSMIHLRVGPYQMQASAGGPHQDSGWLSFYEPGTNTPVWEFAPGGKVDIEGMTDRDLAGSDDAADPGPTERVLDLGSGGRVIRVRAGEMYFARHIADTNRVYALEIASRKDGVLVTRYVPVEPGSDGTAILAQFISSPPIRDHSESSSRYE